MYLILGIWSMVKPPSASTSILHSKQNISTSMRNQDSLKSNGFSHQKFGNQLIEKRIRRRRRNRNDGILRLGVTDNINVLLDRLLEELFRRQQQVRKSVQDRLDTIG